MHSWKEAEESGMVVMEINQLTGFKALNVDDLKKQGNEVIKRVENKDDKVILYLDEVIFIKSKWCILMLSNKIYKFERTIVALFGSPLVVSKLSSQVQWSDLYCPAPGTRGQTCLRSMERGLLFVPFARTSTRQTRSFSMVGPSVWNGLPLAHWLLPRILADTFYSSLKTVLLSCAGIGSISE